MISKHPDSVHFPRSKQQEHKGNSMNRFITGASSIAAFFALLSPNSLSAATIAQTFTTNYQCNSTVQLHAQAGVSQQQLIASCNEIAETDQAFHNFFNTNPNSPLPNDYNDTLDVYIYLSSAEYKANAGTHFGISTDNGGMYLEGTPSNVNNQAKFIAHICEDSWVPFSCSYQGQVYNLQHEYVHYLDGRFNVAGPQGTFAYNAGLAEGLADYLANGLNYSRTIDGVTNLEIPPLYNILSANYYHPDLYKWGYLAIHYLNNNHRADYDQIVTALRTGNTVNYRTAIKDVANRIGNGFDAYVTSLTSAVAINRGTLPADNTFGACNLEHKYVRYVDDPSTQNISVRNTTEVPMRLMWIDNVTGDAGTEEIALLTQGQEYNNNFWRLNDRFMMMSENRECVGVGIVGTTSTFEIDNALVSNVVPDVLPLPNEVGACSLERPYFKGDETANATIINNSNETIEIRWVNYVTGQRSDTVYASVNSGESFNASGWSQGDRMIFVDTTNTCKGVAILRTGENRFSFNGEQQVNQRPTAEINGPYSTTENSNIGFSSSGSSDPDGQIASYSWTFGDGSSSSLPNPNHVYSNAGTYNVTLTVTDNLGATATSSTNVTVTAEDNGTGNNTIPDACANQTGITGGRLEAGEAACLGNSSLIWLSVTGVNNHNSITVRTAHGAGDLSIDYSNSGWPNGANSDGSSDNMGNNECIHVTGASNYYGYLKVSGSTGSSSILVEFDGIGCNSNGGNQNNAPVASVNGTYSGIVDTPVNFTSSGSMDTDGTLTSYYWDFGDGQNSTHANPNHVYGNPGTYTVTLTVTDNQNASSSQTTSATISSTQTGGNGVVDACMTESTTSGWVNVNDDMCVPSGSWNNAIAYYGIYIPPGTSSLQISSDFGTGNGDIYYNATGWATQSNYYQRSENQGNTETITISNPATGYHYFSVIGAQSGMAIKASTQ